MDKRRSRTAILKAILATRVTTGQYYLIYLIYLLLESDCLLYLESMINKHKLNNKTKQDK